MNRRRRYSHNMVFAKFGTGAGKSRFILSDSFRGACFLMLSLLDGRDKIAECLDELAVVDHEMNGGELVF